MHNGLKSLNRSILVATSVLLFLGIAIPGADAAASSISPLRHAWAPQVTCKNWHVFISQYNGGWGWADGSSPHTFYIRNKGNETRFCDRGPDDSVEFVQYGTDRCLYLEDSPRQVIEGDCASVRAKWNVIEISTGPYKYDDLVQSRHNRQCIWENGINKPVTYKACDGSNPRDLFY
jgi:hypothetical protein